MTGWDGVTLGGTPRRVSGLNLDSRRLTGSIPAGLGSLAGLKTLALSGNQLSGEIPAQLGQLTLLRELLLSGNQLRGAIPSQFGDFTLLRRLGLNDNLLTGAVPEELANLTALMYVNISGNTLNGCVPGVWADVPNNDLETLGLPYCGITLSYDTYDTTGAVTEAGSYAFLTEAGDGAMTAVSTYEGLRDGTTSALLIHKSDAGGASRTKFYDAVEAGDLFEWKEANDCFVRYTVSEVKPDPAGAVPRKSLRVESIAYAFTGCSGAIATGSAPGSAANSASSSPASVTWGALPNLGGDLADRPNRAGSLPACPCWLDRCHEAGEPSNACASHDPVGRGDEPGRGAQVAPLARAGAVGGLEVLLRCERG